MPKPLLNISHNSLRQIIVDDDAKELVKQAEAIGTTLGQNLTTNQIRAIFGTVRQIEMTWGKETATRQLILLKPKMAYRASKEGITTRGRGLHALAQVLSDAIDLVVAQDTTDVDQAERFRRFVDFFEAILAYHKVAGGK